MATDIKINFTTVIAAIFLTVFGVMVALAWNAAAVDTFNRLFPEDEPYALIAYALVLTAIFAALAYIALKFYPSLKHKLI